MHAATLRRRGGRTLHHDGDRLAFAASTGADAFSDLRITAEVRGGVTGSLVTFGDGQDTVWLRLVAPTQLGANDFVFG